MKIYNTKTGFYYKWCRHDQNGNVTIVWTKLGQVSQATDLHLDAAEAVARQLFALDNTLSLRILN